MSTVYVMFYLTTSKVSWCSTNLSMYLLWRVSKQPLIKLQRSICDLHRRQTHVRHERLSQTQWSGVSFELLLFHFLPSIHVLSSRCVSLSVSLSLSPLRSG